MRKYLFALLAALIVVGSLYSIGYTMGKMAERGAQQEASAARQKVIDEELGVIKKRNNELEIENAKLKIDTDLKYTAQDKEIHRMYAANLKLSNELSGLRDPGRRAHNCPVPSSPGGADVSADTATGAELSAEASQFLLEFARDADAAASYANFCRSYSLKLQEQLEAAYANCSGGNADGKQKRTSVQDGSTEVH